MTKTDKITFIITSKYRIMKLRDFKNEFRLICTDTWGDAIDAWFECAGHMYKKGCIIPDEWEYKQGLGGGTDNNAKCMASKPRTKL